MNAAIDFKKLLPAWQDLQAIVPVSHIDSEAGYAQTVQLLDALLDVVRNNTSHPLYSLVAVVGDLIEAYELDHEPKVNH
jgi:HTH-type transcriptional regulator/antitoxin HigA